MQGFSERSEEPLSRDKLTSAHQRGKEDVNTQVELCDLASRSYE